MARVLLVITALWLSLHLYPACAAVPAARVPAWRELTTQQQQVLAPVADEWDKMPTPQRNRLLGVAKRYPKMAPEEQQRVQARLKAWSKLTPEQRKAAREKYQKLKQLPPEKRHAIKQKWKAQRETKAAPPGKPSTPNAAPLTPAQTQPAVGAPKAP